MYQIFITVHNLEIYIYIYINFVYAFLYSPISLGSLKMVS